MKSKCVWTFALIVFLSGFGLIACNRADRVEAAREPDTVADRNAMTDDDKDFTTYAAEMHNGEIAMAHQAKDKSANEDVRLYADSVMKLHSGALKDLSQGLGSQSSESSWDTKSHMDELGKMSGTQFDQRYVELMIADQQSARDTFREEMNATQNKDLKAYVNDALPRLEKGLREGQALQSKLKGTASN
jgi:putative membrane protein